MKKLLLIAALTISSSSFAKQYNIDEHHTFPTFSYNHLGFSNQTHKFNKSTGFVNFDSSKKELSVDINIEISSVNTGSNLFNQHLMAEDFFNEKLYPYANFKSNSLEYVKGKPAYMHGDLTIKGITKHVKFKILSLKEDKHPMTGKPALGVNAVTKIKRSDFGLGKYAPSVSDDVTINISFEGQEN